MYFRRKASRAPGGSDAMAESICGAMRDQSAGAV
jgi:hypothetical protein